MGKFLISVGVFFEKLFQFLMIIVSFVLTIVACFWIVFSICVGDLKHVVVWCAVLVSAIYLNRSLQGGERNK